MNKSVFMLVSITLLLIIIAFSLGLFFYNFNGLFSPEQQDWGAFGSYISGTIGVFSACLAVVWLIRSVNLQQVELQHLKTELKNSYEEQKKQTQINALTALLTSNQQAIANDRTLLSTIYNSPEGDKIKSENGILALELCSVSIKSRINGINDQICFYEKELECYLTKIYETD
ncbi:hypothetical protein [Shewanella frigidimarina]|uniref:hypothetical protein n=1 Tax=Shewanella frigidimarina TaxID=56812 RepID=UPI003D79E4EB